MEIILPAVSAGPVAVFDCTLDWRISEATRVQETAQYAVEASVDPLAGPSPALDAAVKIAVEKVVAYKLQRRAWQDLQEGNVTQATAKLRMVATRLLAAGESDLARTVQAEAEHLEKHGFTSAIGTKQIKYGTRGLGRTRTMRTAEPASHPSVAERRGL
jgi:Ca-activated chloride channel family protein